MERRGWTHLVVYGDREHFANLLWLAGFDPRFEEALLIVRLKGDPLMLAGNECVNYLPATPAPMRVERFQWLSLPSMPKDESRTLAEILRDEGVMRIRGWGCGLKEYDDPRRIDAPSYMVDAVRFAGWENVETPPGCLSIRRRLRTVATAGDRLFRVDRDTGERRMRQVLEAVERRLTMTC
jgi:hypothetical protein